MAPSLPSVKPAAVATLANDTACDDVRLLLLTLELWNPTDPPVVFLYCDSRVSSQLVRLRYAGDIVAKEALNRYAGLDRLTMERMRGRTHATLFADYVAQKCDLLEWALAEVPDEQTCRDACSLLGHRPRSWTLRPDGRGPSPRFDPHALG